MNIRETLLPSQGPFTCTGCGATSQSSEGWLLTPSADKQSVTALCPTCKMAAETELAQQSQGINMPRAALYGAVAAVAGAGVWYGLVLATDYKLGLVAIGLGWLVGKGVVWGAGNKRGASLQLLGGGLALAGLLLGEYLIVNHFVRQAVEGFEGWLAPGAFLEIYPRMLAEGNWFLDVVFYLIALYEGYIQPRPVKLAEPN